ncbi:unnamed protein product, partial [Pylaiella littoralis]
GGGGRPPAWRSGALDASRACGFYLAACRRRARVEEALHHARVVVRSSPVHPRFREHVSFPFRPSCDFPGGQPFAERPTLHRTTKLEPGLDRAQVFALPREQR